MSKLANIMIGNTSKRRVSGGGGWIGKGQVIASYEDAIPLADVQDTLLNWEPLEVPNANLIPVTMDDGFDTIINGQPYQINVRNDFKGIVRSDNFESLGVFKNGYDSAAYQRILKVLQDALQGHLSVWNAGLLGGGRKFFLTAALDETMHDSKSGLDFLPYLMFQSSLDGSLANTFTPGTQVAQCDNQFQGFRKAAGDRLVRFKRSRYSMGEARIKTLRDALGILTLEAEDFTADIHQLVDIPLTRSQWLKVLDVRIPLPDENKASKIAVTKATNLRGEIDAMYQLSPMVAPWTGTAFGAVQAFSTWENREKPSRGGVTKVERTFERVLRGDMADNDAASIAALELVLDRPVLVS